MKAYRLRNISEERSDDFLSQICAAAAKMATLFDEAPTGAPPNQRSNFSEKLRQLQAEIGIRCQLFQLLEADLVKNEVPLDEAQRIVAFVGRIVTELIVPFHTQPLERLRNARSKLDRFNPKYAGAVRFVSLDDSLSDYSIDQIWDSAEIRKALPVFEWNLDYLDSGTDVPEHPLHLTVSQTAAIERLEFFWNLRNSHRRVAGIDTRPIPLICGPTGVGKTALVREFCRKLNLPVVELNSGNWLPNGSRGDIAWTLQIVQNFVLQNEHGVILIDELDKFTARTSDWNRHIQQELMALLDNRVNEAWRWRTETRKRLGTRFLLVGCGTWQEMHRKSHKRIGFVTAVSAVPDHSGITVSEQDEIPVEILNRFNASVIHVHPPNRDEIRLRVLEMHRELHVPEPSMDRLDELVEEAHASGLNTRWLEGYLSQLLYCTAGKPNDRTEATHESDGPKEAVERAFPNKTRIKNPSVPGSAEEIQLSFPDFNAQHDSTLIPTPRTLD